MNPFRFGKVVRGEDFCDREEEIKRLVGAVEAGVSVCVISPRRYGKTSLIIEALERSGMEYAYVDLMGITTLSDLSKSISKAILEKKGTLKRGIEAVKGIFPKLKRIRVELSGGGVELELENDMESFEAVLEGIENFGGVVVFDEFQEILNIPQDVLSIMRKHFQHFRRSRIVFSGSRRSVLESIFSDPEKPFYRFSRLLKLWKLPCDEVEDFIRRKVEESGKTITEGALEEICKTTEGHPFYVQYVSYVSWEGASDTIDVGDVERATEEVLESEEGAFEVLWDSLTRNQKRVLKALAKGMKPYEVDMSAGSVKRALEALERMDIIKGDGDYEFVDPIFKIWVAKL